MILRDLTLRRGRLKHALDLAARNIIPRVSRL